MTNPEIERAILWLLDTPQRQRPKYIIPYLRRIFGLSAIEACQALRKANERKWAA